jgi:hypothetical protein
MLALLCDGDSFLESSVHECSSKYADLSRPLSEAFVIWRKQHGPSALRAKNACAQSPDARDIAEDIAAARAAQRQMTGTDWRDTCQGLQKELESDVWDELYNPVEKR